MTSEERERTINDLANGRTVSRLRVDCTVSIGEQVARARVWNTEPADAMLWSCDIAFTTLRDSVQATIAARRCAAIWAADWIDPTTQAG